MTANPVPAKSPAGGARKATLAALMGTMFAASLTAGLTQWEGKRNVGYLDIVGVPTACMGDTNDVIVGKFYGDAECHDRLERQAIVHVREVQRCTPAIRGDQLVAAGLLAYNIGGSAYCRSTVARRFNAGAIRSACDAFRMWRMAGGRVIRGLVNRREFERAICLRGVA